MRYHIDTIPVWDAMKLEGECPLCALRRKLELGEVERYLGASVMEPDTRIQVNEKGFCARHHAMLFAASNRLGHALMLHTHLKETEKRLEKPLERAEKAAKAYTECSLAARLTAKGQAARKELEQAARDMASLGQSCILCDSLQANMDRYVATFSISMSMTRTSARTWRSPRGSVCRTQPCSWKKPQHFSPPSWWDPLPGSWPP